MNRWNRPLLTMVSLLLCSQASATGPATSTSESQRPGRAPALSDAERYARRCQGYAQGRSPQPQGTMLWGTRRAWKDSPQGSAEVRSMLVSVDLTSPREAD